MEASSSRLAEEENQEQGIDEQDVFHCVVFFLAALTVRLFNRVLGADDASFGPIMGKSCYAESALEGWPRVTKKMRKSFQELCITTS